MIKENKMLVCVGFVVLLVAVVAIGAWCWQFGAQELSSSTADWAAFGSFISGVLGPALSLLTILYMFISLRKQTALVREQMEKDRERDERELLLNEIRQLAEKCEAYCTDPVDMGEIAESYIKCFLEEEDGYDANDFKVVDKSTARVKELYFYGGMMFLLRGLEEKRGRVVLKQYLMENKRKKIEYSVRLATVTVTRLVELSLKALVKNTPSDIIRFSILPCYPYAKTLYEWEYLSEGIFFKLNMIMECPDQPVEWEELFEKAYLSEFIRETNQQKLPENFTFKVHVENGYLLKMLAVDEANDTTWERYPMGEWKKAS